MTINKPAKSLKNNRSQKPWSDFPDCPICRAMNEGRGNTLEDLKRVFKEANKKVS